MMAARQLWLGAPPAWSKVDHCDPRAVDLADRHYSRQTPGSYQFTPPGEKLVLWHDCGGCQAVWAVVHNHGPMGSGMRWRCTLFRREAGRFSCEARTSDLVRAATDLTRAHWVAPRYMAPFVPLQTEVDPALTRRKRDPGRCFRRAGWTLVRVDRRGRHVLEAPP